MPDWPKVVVILALCCVPLAGLAEQGNQVTVFFSVSIPPADEREAQWRQQAVAPEEDCDDLLSSSRQPEANTCREGLVVYTWDRDDDTTLLTVAPI